MKRARNQIHGDAPKYGKIAKEYRTWARIHQRCKNPKNNMYKYYGGRGITVCSRWLVYQNFLSDMGRAPSPKHTIDRIDNNGNYEPGNCRWALPDVQQNNRRNSVLFQYNGEKKPLKAWSILYGVGLGLLVSRVYVHGWDLEKALLTPKKAWHRKTIVVKTTAK